MRVSQEFLRLVDDWRRHEPDIPGRSEAIRRLALKGMDAEENLAFFRERLVEIDKTLSRLDDAPEPDRDELRIELERFAAAYKTLADRYGRAISQKADDDKK